MTERWSRYRSYSSGEFMLFTFPHSEAEPTEVMRHQGTYRGYAGPRSFRSHPVQPSDVLVHPTISRLDEADPIPLVVLILLGSLWQR